MIFLEIYAQRGLGWPLWAYFSLSINFWKVNRLMRYRQTFFDILRALSYRDNEGFFETRAQIICSDTTPTEWRFREHLTFSTSLKRFTHLLMNYFDFCMYFAVAWAFSRPLGCKHIKTAMLRRKSGTFCFFLRKKNQVFFHCSHLKVHLFHIPFNASYS